MILGQSMADRRGSPRIIRIDECRRTPKSLREMTMLRLLKIASVIIWTVAVLIAFAWLGLAGIDYLRGLCHGLGECSARVSSLNDAFGVFFVLGCLLDGTEWLIRRRRGPRV
jgi:hypothetical protein